MLFDLERLLTHWNVLLVLGAWTIVTATKAVCSEFFAESRLGRALLPLFPLAVCSVLVWVPGPWLAPSASVGEHIVLGLVLGMLTGSVHTILKRFGLHGLVDRVLHR